MAVNYNIINLPIDTALDNREISGGKTYLILLKAPVGANVRVRLEENTADEIPLSSDYALKCGKANRIYVSSDAVSGGAIKLGVSDTTFNGFEIIPSPVVDSIDTIGEVTELAGISTALNMALDKIINPYEIPIIKKGSSNATALTTLLSYTATCDDIKVNFSIFRNDGNFDSYGTNMAIGLYIDGELVLYAYQYSSVGGEKNLSDYFKNVKGKLIEIKSKSTSSVDVKTYRIEEYTLKA